MHDPTEQTTDDQAADQRPELGDDAVGFGEHLNFHILLRLDYVIQELV